MKVMCHAPVPKWLRQAWFSTLYILVMALSQLCFELTWLTCLPEELGQQCYGLFPEIFIQSFFMSVLWVLCECPPVSFWCCLQPYWRMGFCSTATYSCRRGEGACDHRNVTLSTFAQDLVLAEAMVVVFICRIPQLVCRQSCMEITLNMQPGYILQRSVQHKLPGRS